MSKTKSSLPLQLAAAALVGALVSFGVTTFMQPKPAEPTPAAADASEKLLDRLATLEARLTASEDSARQEREERTRLARELGAAVASNAAGLNAQGTTLSGIEQRQIATGATIKNLEASYSALNGRIEGNYTKLRAAERRLKALETR